MATTDSLTGVLNRRAFFARSQQVFERAAAGVPISAIMLDIDNFKRINDRFGHSQGDQVICRVAAEAQKDERIVARLGGEEFAVILEAGMTTALEIAERLRADIAAFVFDTPKGPLTFTSSFGVSEWREGDDLDELLRRADIALYAAKAAGRNRVVADQPGLWVMDYDQHPSVIRNAVRAVPAA